MGEDDTVNVKVFPEQARLSRAREVQSRLSRARQVQARFPGPGKTSPSLQFVWFRASRSANVAVLLSWRDGGSKTAKILELEEKVILTLTFALALTLTQASCLGVRICYHI